MLALEEEGGDGGSGGDGGRHRSQTSSAARLRYDLPVPKKPSLASSAVVALAALLTCATSVTADPTPSPEPVGSCTIESQQHAGEECIMCGVMQGDPAKCLKRLASRGYTRRCRGEGTAQWLELWCRRAPAGGGSPPAR